MYKIHRPAMPPVNHPITIEYDNFDEFNAYFLDCGITLKELLYVGYKVFIDDLEILP